MPPSDAETPGDCAQEREITRTWTATDACGNSSTCVQILEYIDEKPPVLQCPPNVDLDCTEDLSQLPLAETYDDCDDAPTLTFEDVIEGDCAHTYTITRTFTSTDNCGNSNTFVQTINVRDEDAPSISGEATIALDCSEMETRSPCTSCR